MRVILGHELFHHVQYSYFDFDDWPAWGGWTVEGTARIMQDKAYSDLDAGAADAACCCSYSGEIANYLGNTNRTLWDISYTTALFWNYLTEQLGSTATEPQRGADFIRRYWEMTEDKEPDSIGVLRDAISEFKPGATLEDVFHDFIIANYAKDLNLAGIPNQQKFQYIDDDPVGAAYAKVNVSNPPLDTEQVDKVCLWGAKYYERAFGNDCQIVGFRSEGDFAAYGLIAIRADGSVSHLFQSKGTSFARAILNDPANPIIRLAAVVGAFDNGVFDVNADCDGDGMAEGSVSLILPIYLAVVTQRLLSKTQPLQGWHLLANLLPLNDFW